jgi:hypothetical protein
LTTPPILAKMEGMNGFFSFFGKLALILLVVGIMVSAGYYLGTGKLPFPTNPPPGAVTTTAPTPTSVAATASPSAAPSPTIATQTVSGGGVSSTSFSAYTITVPTTWTVKKEVTAGVSEKITISRGTYSMNIYQAATGGGGCIYPGDAPAEMSSTFGAYTTLHDASGGEFRRATPAGSASGFTVCQKSAWTPSSRHSKNHKTFV